ncbi:MAG: hypothetical protein DWQ04_28545, partial [Chloroflexi bacterium]
AYHALNNSTPIEPVAVDEQLLINAYAVSASITQEHSRTFYMASSLLPEEQQEAARALYAFCRVSDDIVDEGEGNRLHELLRWRNESLGNHSRKESPVALAWADTRSKYMIPRQYAEQLLDGVACDLAQDRFATFNELAHYCYGVASTVGLMTMHIVGYSGEEAIPYAIKLGVALQLTNILRDVGEDWENGRLYLPQDELTKFGLTEYDIDSGLISNRWREFMQFQIDRARRLYAEALPGIGMLGENGRFAIAAAAELYKGILDDIEANDYNVFTHRAHLTGWEKLRKLPGIWWRSRTNHYGKLARHTLHSESPKEMESLHAELNLA